MPTSPAESTVTRFVIVPPEEAVFRTKLPPLPEASRNPVISDPPEVDVETVEFLNLSDTLSEPAPAELLNCKAKTSPVAEEAISVLPLGLAVPMPNRAAPPRIKSSVDSSQCI